MQVLEPLPIPSDVNGAEAAAMAVAALERLKEDGVADGIVMRVPYDEAFEVELAESMIRDDPHLVVDSYMENEGTTLRIVVLKPEPLPEAQIIRPAHAPWKARPQPQHAEAATAWQPVNRHPQPAPMSPKLAKFLQRQIAKMKKGREVEIIPDNLPEALTIRDYLERTSNVLVQSHPACPGESPAGTITARMVKGLDALAEPQVPEKEADPRGFREVE